MFNTRDFTEANLNAMSADSRFVDQFNFEIQLATVDGDDLQIVANCYRRLTRRRLTGICVIVLQAHSDSAVKTTTIFEWNVAIDNLQAHDATSTNSE